MENIFELNIFDHDYLENMDTSVDYVEFSAYVESLDELLSKAVFIEAAVGQHQGIKRGLQNTVKTTKDVASIYGDVTDGGGSLLGSTFQLVTSIASLIAKILKFVLKNLAKIPQALGKAIRYLTRIPEKVIAKVRGDIQLYVTVDDLLLLRDRVQGDLGDFITLATSFTEVGNYKYDVGIPFISHVTNDFKTYKAMNTIYKRVSNVSFEKSTVRMNNKEVINTYLSPKSQYYKSLELTLKFLNDKKPELEKLVKAATDKFDANQIKGVVSKLSPENQIRAKNSAQMISKVISIIGNLVKYIISDVSTINKMIMKLLESDKKNLLGEDNIDKMFPDDPDDKK